MVKIILPGNAKSTNHIYKYTCRGKFGSMYMTKEGKDLKELYIWHMLSQREKGKIYYTNIEVTIALYFNDKRKRDVDNYNKIILDAGTNTLWEDDELIQKITIEKFYDKENPRIEIYIKEYEQHV